MRLLAMFALALSALLGAFALGVVWPESEATPVISGRPIAITGVSVLDVRKGVHQVGRTVLVDGGRIVSVAADGEVELPADAEVVDARGKFLMPALWDMHGHVFAVSPLLDLPLYIAFGVTGVRDMTSCAEAGDPFVACPEDKQRWSEEALRGERVGPRILSTSSFLANGPVMRERMPSLPAFFATSNADEGRAFVRHYAGRVDEIKVYDRLPREAYFAMVDEARRLGLAVVGHRPQAVSAIEAARHQKSIEHARFLLHESFAGSEALRAVGGTADWREDRRRMLDEHDPAMLEPIFAAMREHGTWYVPTHLTRWSDAYADRPEVTEDPLLRYLHPLLWWQWYEDVQATVSRDPSPEARATYREFHAKGLALTGGAHRAGVRVLLGTDYIVAGPDTHRELQQLVLAGLSPAEAIRAGTLSAAEYYGQPHDFGSVEPGRVADLILLDADPLIDIGNTLAIRAVLFNGNLYDRAALDSIDRLVLDRARSWSVGCKLLWRFIKQPVNY